MVEDKITKNARPKAQIKERMADDAWQRALGAPATPPSSRDSIGMFTHKLRNISANELKFKLVWSRCQRRHTSAGVIKES